MVSTILFYFLLAVAVLQVILLVFNEKIDIYISSNLLDFVSFVESVLVLAVGIYSCPKISFYSSWFLHMIGVSLVLLLVLMVWRSLFKNTIQKDKLYAMSQLNCHSRNAGDKYRVMGTINEGRHDIDVYVELEEEKFLRLRSQGYFDEQSSQILIVKLSRRISAEQENGFADAEMKVIW